VLLDGKSAVSFVEGLFTKRASLPQRRIEVVEKRANGGDAPGEFAALFRQATQALIQFLTVVIEFDQRSVEVSDINDDVCFFCKSIYLPLPCIVGCLVFCPLFAHSCAISSHKIVVLKLTLLHPQLFELGPTADLFLSELHQLITGQLKSCSLRALFLAKRFTRTPDVADQARETIDRKKRLKLLFESGAACSCRIDVSLA
jgi:hypothetical protein